MTSHSDFVLTDLHGHSALSDGMTTPEAYVRARAEQGLEVIALSDHDVLAGVQQAAPLAASLGMTLPEELIETIRADGAIDVVAHPNRVRDTARMGKVLALAEGVEVYTSRHSETIAAKFLDYATTHHKLWTASTDDHQHVRQIPYRRPPSGTPRRSVERLLSGR